MKEVTIDNPEQFLYLLDSALLHAPIVSKKLEVALVSIHASMRNLKFEGERDAMGYLSIKIAEFIYQNYDKVLVSSDDMVYGVTDGGEKELLYDGTECKVYFDACTF